MQKVDKQDGHNSCCERPKCAPGVASFCVGGTINDSCGFICEQVGSVVDRQSALSYIFTFTLQNSFNWHQNDKS